MICQSTDLTGNGELAVIVSGNEDEPAIYWYERSGWERHMVDRGTAMHRGKGVDLTGSGLPDIVGKNDTEDPHVDVLYNEC